MSKNFTNLLGGAFVSKAADESSVRNRIIVREEFKSLIPSLTKEELAQLEENILKEGIRDPIMLWSVNDTFIIVDGHNRYMISQKHGLEFPFKQLLFKDEEEVRGWMIKNQLGRRNLSQEQQSYLRGLRYNREKSQGKRMDLTSDQNDLKSSFSTAAALGEEYNVSEATIKRDGEFAKSIDAIGSDNPDLKQEILNGESNLTKKQISALAKGKSKSQGDSSEREKFKVSANQIVKIAFEYIQTERRSIEEIYLALAKEPDSLQAREFFTLWKALTEDANR